jgi:hypothetical protein
MIFLIVSKEKRKEGGKFERGDIRFIEIIRRELVKDLG